jgi:nucleoside-diphosphate-sugar epimerase
MRDHECLGEVSFRETDLLLKRGCPRRIGRKSHPSSEIGSYPSLCNIGTCLRTIRRSGSRRRGECHDIWILRLFGAFGPWEPQRKMHSRLVRTLSLMRSEWFETRGDGSNFIDAMCFDDCIEGVLSTTRSGLSDAVIDFAKGEPMTVDELVMRAARTLGIERVEIVHQGFTAESIRFYPDLEVFRQAFGWEPKTTLERGLESLSSWLSSSRHESGGGRGKP